jgi:hypothetical protein
MGSSRGVFERKITAQNFKVENSQNTKLTIDNQEEV